METKTQHTPGPWKARPPQGGRFGWGIVPANAAIPWITTLDSYGDRPHYEAEQEANARLISAAPELLEALRAVIGGKYLSDAMKMARAAIRKAESGHE